ncbi:unnamed protein product [Ophioblennius macclurei]
MMEQRRALTIPFTVKKDNRMDNPLIIPMSCLSSEVGKIERQVPWTAFAGCKPRHNSQHKNGSTVLDVGRTAMISMEMSRRKPQLLLTDVLKTEAGRAYMERMAAAAAAKDRLTRRSSSERETPRRRTSVQPISERKSIQTESRSNGRKSGTPKARQKPPPQSSKRSNLRRRVQNSSDEVDNDTEDVKSDEDGEDADRFAEVVDCGLSVSWEPSEDTDSRDGFSPADIKEQRSETGNDVQHSTKRKRKDSGSRCNGTGSPKRHRRSVLRLTGGETPQQTGEEAELDGLDGNIVQFTVGGDDQTQVLLPVNCPTLAAGDLINSHKRGPAPGPENAANAKTSEPIVLSSDDEENGNVTRPCGQAAAAAACRRVTVGDSVIQGLSLLHKAAPRRTSLPALQNIEVLQVVVQDIPRLVAAPSIPDDDYARIEVAFSALHCGGFYGKSNGDVMIEKQKIIIPLQDASEEMEVILSFSSKELRRYSVWEQQELEEEELCFRDDEEPHPAAVLLFFVSEYAATAVQRDLGRLGVRRTRAARSGKASPFILLTLPCPLEGVKGALLRSVLDIECLNTMGKEQVSLTDNMDKYDSLDDLLNPVLSLEQSIALIRRTGLDSHLLSMLGVKGADPEPNVERSRSQSEQHKSPAKAPTRPEVKSPRESQVVKVDISHLLLQEARDPRTSPPQKTRTSTPQEPKVSPRKTSRLQERKTSPPRELEASPLKEPETSPVLEREISPVLEREDSLSLESKTSSQQEEDIFFSSLESESPPTLEREASPALQPEASPTPEPKTPPSVKSDTSPSLELEGSAAAEPETAQEEEDVEEEDVEEEEEEGTKLKPKEDLKVGEVEDAPCEEEEEKTEEKEKEEEEEEAAPVYTLCHRRNKGCYSVSMCKPDSKWTKYKHLGLARRLIQFPPPPQKGGITVTMEDLQCLDSGQFLNDVIIDFYLKYLLQNASSHVAERTHIFSSFFYKQLTRRDNASEGGSNESCQRQRRHQRVKTWTRHVDIFKKDFLFVPVNQEAHWYLVVICFPGLDEPKFHDRVGPGGQDEEEESPSAEEAKGGGSSNDAADEPPSLSPSSSVNTPTEKAPEHATKDFIHCPVKCTELTCQEKTVCTRPCILIMDSLKLSLHERVVKLLRDYLQSEWEVRRGTSREFGPDQMKSSHCKVPLQDNSSDCGLYLLQYVESFLKDPVVHFVLPLCLERWFPRQQVRRKRDGIRDLILYLYRLQNLDLRHVELPGF